MTQIRNPAGYSRNVVETAAFKPGVEREFVQNNCTAVIPPTTSRRRRTARNSRRIFGRPK